MENNEFGAALGNGFLTFLRNSMKFIIWLFKKLFIKKCCR